MLRLQMLRLQIAQAGFAQLAQAHLTQGPERRPQSRCCRWGVGYLCVAAWLV